VSSAGGSASGPRLFARRRSALPGFGFTLGLTWIWLGALVLLPLSALVAKALALSPAGFVRLATEPRTLSAIGLTFGASLAAAAIDAVLGTLLAWVLARDRFPGHALLDAVVDLPFALPTAVAGLTLTALLSREGWLGRLFPSIQIPFTRAGVVLALAFVGLPFVVRAVQPALAGLSADVEEAAATLGASRLQIALRVVLPQVLPALLTGAALTVARALGEYGSIVFISGNLPYRTEIAPLLIVTRLEQYDYAGATALAVILLASSFLLLSVVHRLQRWSARGLTSEVRA
jgi:sulfate/thiosulfate transport system permease protein